MKVTKERDNMTYEIKTNSLNDYLHEIEDVTNALGELESKAEVLKADLQFLTVSEVAKIMHLSLPTVREIFHRPDFPACDYGKEMVVEKNAFLKYFQKPVKKL